MMVLRPWMYGLIALGFAALGRIGADADAQGCVFLGVAGVCACLWMHIGATEYWANR